MSLKYVAAYLLASTVHEEVDGKLIQSILDSVGIKCDEKELGIFIDGVKKGQDINAMLPRAIADHQSTTKALEPPHIHSDDDCCDGSCGWYHDECPDPPEPVEYLASLFD
jgi:hypothetical protein